MFTSLVTDLPSSVAQNQGVWDSALACWSRAVTEDRRRLLRLVVEAPIADPWAALDELPDHSPFMAWNDDRRGLCLAALGAELRFEADGPGRFEAVQRDYSQLLEQVHPVELGPLSGGAGGEAPLDLPVAVGGFSFSQAGGRVGRWRQWPAASFTVPREVVFRRTMADGTVRSGVVFQRLMDHTIRPEAVALDIVHHISNLSQMQSVPQRETLSGERLRWATVDSEAWCACAESARTAVAHGPLEKLVLARSETTALSNGWRVDPILSIRGLRRRQTRCHTFAFRSAGDDVFLGASPESMVHIEGADLRTHALAGTAPRTGAADRDDALAAELLASPKERNEHRLVVSAMESALSRLCTTLSVADQPSVSAFADVQHLETRIAGQLQPDVDILDVVATVHPTPAVGGTPQGEACRWLASHEQLHRGWYAGPVGWLGRNGGSFSVALRCALVSQSGATVFAGAGIVSESDPRAEWDETRHKLKAAQASLVLEPAT